MFLLISNIILEIFLQNCLLAHTALSSEITGIVSIIPTLAYSLFATVLLSKSGAYSQLIGIVLVLCAYIVSIVGMFVTVASSGWAIAFLIGIVSEVLIAQTVVMLVTRALKI